MRYSEGMNEYSILFISLLQFHKNTSLFVSRLLSKSYLQFEDTCLNVLVDVLFSSLSHLTLLSRHKLTNISYTFSFLFLLSLLVASWETRKCGLNNTDMFLEEEKQVTFNIVASQMFSRDIWKNNRKNYGKENIINDNAGQACLTEHNILWMVGIETALIH